MKSFLAYFLIFNALILHSQQQEKFELTIYNNNFGAVRDIRNVSLTSGPNEVKFSGVPPTIISESIFLNFPGRIFEQSYRNDFAGRELLLSKLLNKKVILKKSSTEVYEGTLLQFNDGYIVKTNQNELVYITDISNFQIIAADFPNDLFINPTVLWKIAPEKSGSQNLELNYLFENITWEVKYIALINDDETQMNLDAYFYLTNKSGFDIVNADVNLISGKVNRQGGNLVGYVSALELNRSSKMITMQSTQDNAEESEISDYKIFDIKEKVNLKSNESKQLYFFDAGNIKIKRKKMYQTFGTYSSNIINSFVSINNSASSGLSRYLPNGHISFYINKSDRMEFIGENIIRHLNIGDSADVLIGEVTGINSEFKVTDTEKSDKYIDSKIEINFENKTDFDEELEIHIGLGYLGDIIKTNTKLIKYDANMQKALIKLPKKGTYKLQYTLRNAQTVK